MKRVFQTFGFLVLSVIMYFATVAGLSRWKTAKGPMIFQTADYYMPPGRGTWMRYQEFDPAKWHDVILIGSSHAYRGYDPWIFRQHGLSSFNLGSPSQSPVNSYVLLDQYVNAKNTGLVVFDVFEYIFNSSGEESASDQIANLPSDGAAFEMAWQLRGIKPFNMFALRLSGPVPDTLKQDPCYHGLGFGAKLDSVKKPPVQKTQTWFPHKEIQDRAFRKCVAHCIEQGIPMVVCQHYARHGLNLEKHAAFVQHVQSMLEGTGIPFLDFSQTPGVDDMHYFVDAGHLNLTGARIFTEQLVDSLESLGYLKEPKP